MDLWAERLRAGLVGTLFGALLTAIAFTCYECGVKP